MNALKKIICVVFVLILIGLCACDSGGSGGYSRPQLSFNSSNSGSDNSDTMLNTTMALTEGYYTFSNALDFKFLSEYSCSTMLC